MSAIFLDIDGVLNNNYTKERSPSGFISIDGTSMPLLKELVDKSHAAIILSSSWRFDDSAWDEEINADYQKRGKKQGRR